MPNDNILSDDAISEIEQRASLGASGDIRALIAHARALAAERDRIEQERDEAREQFATWYGRAFASAEECQRLSARLQSLESE